MTKLIQLTEQDVRYTDHKDHLLRTFTTGTAGHEMTVFREDGVYRHLRFRTPDNGFYWFDLITWPGYLTITGDMGTYTFNRNEDMFAFFNGTHVNTGYWAEKLRHGSNGGRSTVREHDGKEFKKWLVQDFWETSRDVEAAEASKWWKNIEKMLRDIWLSVDTVDECDHVLGELGVLNGTPEDHYVDFWEVASSWEKYDLSFELCLAAILTGVRTYNACKTAQEATEDELIHKIATAEAERVARGEGIALARMVRRIITAYKQAEQ